jgi:hypothetical protein
MNDKTKYSCVLLDLSKAFDCISHNILKDKLNNYGIQGIPHKLMKSYLTNRTQHVKVTHIENNLMKDYLSDSLPVGYGVPQGLILSPLLFILYIATCFSGNVTVISEFFTSCNYNYSFYNFITHKEESCLGLLDSSELLVVNSS